MNMDYPLVSAITPTYNRRAFFPRAVKCFLAQDYPRLEWVILDDGTDPIRDVLPDDPRIRYFYEQPKRNHGEKMNRCFELMQGEIGIVHDDDDLYPSTRIFRQIASMIQDPNIQVCGTSTLYYYVHGTKQAYQYASPIGIGWLASIAVRKSAWLQHRFDNISGGADYNFQRQTPVEARYDLKDPTLVIASAHGTNACKKSLGGGYTPVPWETIEGFLRE
jgi:glycosyltransferase involved in cell wall biosynthesis